MFCDLSFFPVVLLKQITLCLQSLQVPLSLRSEKLKHFLGANSNKESFYSKRRNKRFEALFDLFFFFSKIHIKNVDNIHKSSTPSIAKTEGCIGLQSTEETKVPCSCLLCHGIPTHNTVIARRSHVSLHQVRGTGAGEGTGPAGHGGVAGPPLRGYH